MAAKFSSSPDEAKRLFSTEWKGWKEITQSSKVIESSTIWLHKQMLTDSEHLVDFKRRLAVFEILDPLLSLLTSQITYLTIAPQNSSA